MADVRCPMCSKLNPDGVEACEHCGARLKPLVAGKSSSDATSNLDALLRSSQDQGEGPGAAREGWRQEKPSAEGEPAEEEEGAEAEPGQPEWLGRLRHADQEEEGPPEGEIPEWVSEGGGEPGTPKEGEVPGWLARVRKRQAADAKATGGAQAQEDDWLIRLRAGAPLLEPVAPSGEEESILPEDFFKDQESLAAGAEEETRGLERPVWPPPMESGPDRGEAVLPSLKEPGRMEAAPSADRGGREAPQGPEPEEEWLGRPPLSGRGPTIPERPLPADREERPPAPPPGPRAEEELPPLTPPQRYKERPSLAARIRRDSRSAAEETAPRPAARPGGAGAGKEPAGLEPTGVRPVPPKESEFLRDLLRAQPPTTGEAADELDFLKDLRGPEAPRAPAEPVDEFDFLKDLRGAQPPETPAPPGEDLGFFGELEGAETPRTPAEPVDELDFLKELRGGQPPETPAPPGEDLGLFGELEGAETPRTPAEPVDEFDFLKHLRGAQHPETPASPVEDLGIFGELEGAEAPRTPAEPVDEFDFLKDLRGAQPPEAPTPPADDLDFLKGLRGAEPGRVPAQPAPPVDELDFLKAFRDVQPAETPAEAGGEPDFLKELRGALPPEPAAEPVSSRQWEEQGIDAFLSSGGAPAWPPAGEVTEGVEAGIPAKPPADELPHVPPLILEEEGALPATEGADVELGRIEVPDWLSQMKGAEAQPGAPPPEAEGKLAPATLPSWLEAMRPMETFRPTVEIKPEEEQAVEGAGPLAGLRGVLLAEPVVAMPRQPTGAPTRLDVTERHYALADLLRRLVAEEERELPGPLVGRRRLPVIRWVIALALILAVALPSFQGAPTFRLPSPLRVNALTTLVSGLPLERPVLVVFDYEPGFAGEMEAVAGGLLEQMMERGLRIATVSTRPTGPPLAERLLSQIGARHGYANAHDYVHLGYLPGGAAAVRNFAQNLRQAIPKGFLLPQGYETAWDSPVLGGIERLSDFGAVVVVAAGTEIARTWVEQASLQLGETPLIMVLSAGAEPLMRPYYEALRPQVDAVLSGIPSAVAYEEANDLPGAARELWDGFGMGMLTAELALVIGAVYGLVSWLMRPRGTQGRG